jgi:hypothetical protein
MGITTFSGPIRAGNIPNTTGTTLGTDVRNVGSVVMAQTAAITQAGTIATTPGTSIVLPANSHILNIQLLVTTAWTTTSNTVSVGTTSTATELVPTAVAANAISLVALTPGANVANWDDTGTTDKRVYVLSNGTGDGVGTLTVRYIQAHDLQSSP